MATGDQQDVYNRLRGYLPRWFGDPAQSPVLNALLQGLAYGGAYVYSLYAYAKLQTRILTATDGWLDMIAADFFGSSLLRAANQSDASFRTRIILNLFRERATRNGMVRVLKDLTGRTPKIIEVTRPADTGAYGAPNCGYNLAGSYGSLVMPYQCFVIAYRPVGTGIPSVAGYGGTIQAGSGYPIAGEFIPIAPTAIGMPGGYGVGQIEYASLSLIQGSVSDADIYAAIEATRPVATTIWASIQSNTPPVPTYLDSTFILDSSRLI